MKQPALTFWRFFWLFYGITFIGDYLLYGTNVRGHPIFIPILLAWSGVWALAWTALFRWFKSGHVFTTNTGSVGLGLKLGVIFTLLCWFGNLTPRPDFWRLHSTFPDLLSLIALPMLVTIVLNILVDQDGQITRSELRKSGVLVVTIAAVLFALSDALLAMTRIYLRLHGVLLRGTIPSNIVERAATFVFTGALIGFLVLGGSTIGVAPKWLVNSETR